MTLTDYHRILGLTAGSSLDEIKKAYRKKARIYHPDVNHSPDAKEQFIVITEAYEFLVTNHEKIKNDEEEYNRAMEDWRKYRQVRSRKRANVYAKSSYMTFKKTSFYKSTRIFDSTTIILSFSISIIVVVYSVAGYIFRLKNPIPGVEKPSFLVLIMFFSIGLIFFIVSFIYLKAYQESSKKHK
jgi:hypothetical protein